MLSGSLFTAFQELCTSSPVLSIFIALAALVLALVLSSKIAKRIAAIKRDHPNAKLGSVSTVLLAVVWLTVALYVLNIVVAVVAAITSLVR